MDYRRETQSFTGLAGLDASPMNLTGNGSPERVWGDSVTANFFAVIGVAPVRGRSFTPEEDRPADAVVVLSCDFWAVGGWAARRTSWNAASCWTPGLTALSAFCRAKSFSDQPVRLDRTHRVLRASRISGGAARGARRPRYRSGRTPAALRHAGARRRSLMASPRAFRSNTPRATKECAP